MANASPASVEIDVMETKEVSGACASAETEEVAEAIDKFDEELFSLAMQPLLKCRDDECEFENISGQRLTSNGKNWSGWPCIVNFEFDVNEIKQKADDWASKMALNGCDPRKDFSRVWAMSKGSKGYATEMWSKRREGSIFEMTFQNLGMNIGDCDDTVKRDCVTFSNESGGARLCKFFFAPEDKFDDWKNIGELAVGPGEEEHALVGSKRPWFERSDAACGCLEGEQPATAWLVVLDEKGKYLQQGFIVAGQRVIFNNEPFEGYRIQHNGMSNGDGVAEACGEGRNIYLGVELLSRQRELCHWGLAIAKEWHTPTLQTCRSTDQTTEITFMEPHMLGEEKATVGILIAGVEGPWSTRLNKAHVAKIVSGNTLTVFVRTRHLAGAPCGRIHVCATTTYEVTGQGAKEKYMTVVGPRGSVALNEKNPDRPRRRSRHLAEYGPRSQQMGGYILLPFRTNRSEQDIQSWIKRWVQMNPYYELGASNCQTFCRDFYGYLVLGEHWFPWRSSAESVVQHLAGSVFSERDFSNQRSRFPQYQSTFVWNSGDGKIEPGLNAMKSGELSGEL